MITNSCLTFFVDYVMFCIGDMMKRNYLGQKQKEILTFIKKYIAINGYSPSVREIASSVGLNSPATVHVHINNLIEMGYLRRSDDKHKSLELMVPNEFEMHEGEAIGVPYIDTIILKNYEYDFEHPDEIFYLSSQMIPKGSEVFVLKVQDDAMNHRGIIKGDHVIVEKTKNFANDDLIVSYSSDFEFIIHDFSFFKQPYNGVLLGRIIGLYREL